MEFELQIKRLMRERGLMTKDLAERMGKSDQYVSNIINGGKGMSINTLREVAAALGVEFWQLTAPENVGIIPSDGNSGNTMTIRCGKCGNEIKIVAEQ